MGKKRAKSRHTAGQRKAAALAVRRVEQANAWEFVHPPCVHARREDLEEVAEMCAHGEEDIAQDELLWLLSECREFLAAHRMLGELAANRGDFELARGHFGHAYEMGTRVLRDARAEGPLPYRLDENRPWHEAGRGLTWTLLRLGRARRAREVAQILLKRDASDPLDVASLLAAIKQGKNASALLDEIPVVPVPKHEAETQPPN